MDIAIVGTGYVGLVSGSCFAEMGANVTCVDVDRRKIDSLKEGKIPIYEPGLEDLVQRNVQKGRLHFTDDLTSCIDDVEIIFSAVGTPPDEDGSADLSYVLDVARTVGRNMNRYVLLVTKSTVPVGTADKVKEVISEELDRRGVDIPFDVFIGVFLIAQVLGVFSQVPGGLGVFEGLFMFIIPGEHNQAMLFGALIAYRIIYYLLPLVFSGVILVGYELALRHARNLRLALIHKIKKNA